MLEHARRGLALCGVLILIVTSAISFPVQAHAQPDSQTDLVVAMAAGKEEYRGDEVVEINLSIRNPSDADHDNVSYRLSIPEGIEVVDGYAQEGTIGTLGEGEESSTRILVRLSSAFARETITMVGEDSALLPATGDGTAIALLIVVGFVSFAILAIGKVRGRKARVLALLLASCLVTGLSFSPAFAAQADRVAEETLVFTIDGDKYTVAVAVTSQISSLSSSDGEGDIPEGIIFQDDVKYADAVAWGSADENGFVASVELASASADFLKIGDVLVVYPDENNIYGTAVRVTGIDRNGSISTVTGEAPTLDELVKSINVQGTTSDMRNIELADGVSFADSGDGDSAEVLCLEVGDLQESAAQPYGAYEGTWDEIGEEDFPIGEHVTLKIKPWFDYSLKYTSLLSVQEASIVANLETTITYQESFEMGEQRLPIYSGSFAIPHTMGMLWIQADVSLVANASGEVTLEAKMTQEAGFEYDRGSVREICDNDLDWFADFEGELRGGVRPAAALSLLNCIKFAYMDVEGGVAVDGRYTVHGDELTCADSTAGFYATMNLNREENIVGSLLDTLNKQTVYELLRKEDSPLWSIHVENGTLVPECTWKEDGGSEGDGGSTGPDPLPDEGGDEYGNTPIFREDGGYGDRLLEPFSVRSGESITLGAIGDSLTIGSSWWFINYECAPGTIFTMTEYNSDGSIQESAKNAFVAFGTTNNRCMGEPIEIEVHCGRVNVTGCWAYYNPAYSQGACQEVDYPLHISSETMAMSVGDAAQLTAWDDFAEVLGQDPGAELHWKSSDPGIVEVDASTGSLRAVKVGSAMIEVTYGTSSYKKSCTVIVS